MKLGAIDGIVLADIHIVTVFSDWQIGAVGNISKVLVGRRGHCVGLAEKLGFLPGFLGKLTGDDVIRHPIAHQVHRHHGKLLAGAALHEQDLVIVRNAHQCPQVRLGFIDDLLVGLGPVAHLHYGHTGAPVVQHFSGGLLQNRLRQNRGTGGKIIDTIHIR